MTISRRHPQATVLGACILAVLASAAANAAPADEQAAATTTPKAAEKAKDQEVAEVVVTGSRLRRTEFTAASPVQIITTEQTSLEGLMSAAEILQSSTLASGSQQINDQTTGFVTENGPGANTLSLRGLGASRTLLLLNGRRLSPAGSRGQLAAADLNVLPESIIQRIEILKDGASSVYGSDAIAGVVNIITRKGFDGGTVGVEGNYITQGGGESRQVSASWGKSWDKGGFSVSLEYFKREPLRVGDRDFMSCAQDRVENVTSNPNSVFFGTVGQPLDIIDPATGESKCFNLLGGVIDRLQTGGRFIPDSTVTAGSGLPGFTNVVNAAGGWRRVGLTYANVTSGLGAASTLQQRLNAWYGSQAIVPNNPAPFAARTFNSPVTRKSAYLEGSWEFSPAFNVYAEALFNQRDSWQNSFRQIFPNVATANWSNPFGQISRSIVTIPTNQEQSVDFKRYVVGANGDFQGFGGNDWKYDIFIQRSESDAAYTGDIIYNDRVLATTGAGTCNQATITISGGTCQQVNWFNPTTIKNGQFSAAESAFLFGRETGSTKYTQTLYGASVNGNLFSLPAGVVAASLGFEGRKDSIDDTPGFNARNSNLWGSTSAGRTAGSDQVKEFFGEVEVPLLADTFLAKRLSLSGSARWTDYDSYGSDTTFKVGLNWQIVDSVRMRGSYGTSFRAPALFELYLANQTGFLGQTSVDPCINWDQSQDPQILANCAAVGLPNGWLNPNSSALIVTGGGAGVLNAETSKAWTAGIVFTPKDWPLSIAADWWRIEVNNQVSQFGAGNIVSSCYGSEDFPNDPFCSLFDRDTTGQPNQFLADGVTPNPAYNSQFGKITTVRNSYVNISNQIAEGVDYNIRWQQKVGAYNFTANAQVTYMLAASSQIFKDFAADNDLDIIYSNKWVSSIDLRLERGPWTLNWSIDALSKASNDRLFGGDTFGWRGFADCGTQATPTTTCVQARYDQTVNMHITHDVSVRYRGDKYSIIAGIQNVLNEDPPLLSTGSGALRQGNSIYLSNYDVLGRRFFVSADYRF